DISVLRKKRNEREEDDVENRAQKVLITDQPDSVDKVRRRVEDLELELGLYDAILNDLIELAESLEKDSKVLSDSTKKEFERVDKEINEKFEELNNRMSRIDSDCGNVVGAESIGKSWADAVTNPGALTFSKQQREMSILLTMEREDEERRSKNIVIFGLVRSEKKIKEDRWQDKHPAYESSMYDNGNRYEQYRDRYEQNRNRYEQYTFPSRPHDGYSRY
ncbi:hypothetical protein BpHYR1_041260, partial [Brachionus plicatilis]